ncbi:MAG: LysR family transcriptional regulator [Negativicutes bacterium]|nr:LysR family transcriptional regulator [Negativicutes bacterium]
MELRQLEYFQMVSRLSSVTRAADRLHVAQPSVTVAIRKLEEELGVKLFDRSQKQLSLTAEGQVYLQRVDDILGRVQDSIAEMNDYKTLQKGSIKIGLTPTIGAALFPYIFTRFQQIYPHLDVTIVEEGSLAVRSLLEQGELDIGVLIISNMSPVLATIPVTAGQIFVCLPPKHPFGKLHASIPFSELKDQPFILFKEDTYSRQLILAECARHEFEPRIVFSSSQIETIMGLVEQGAGISFLLDAIARKRSTIISRPLSDPLFVRAGLAWHKERYLSNAAKTFIDFIKDFPTI